MTSEEPVTTEDTAATVATEDTAATVADTRTAPAASPSRLQKWIAPVLLAALLLASAGVAGWLYFTDYRTDQQIDETARQAVLTAAADGAVALLSYSPATLDADFANAKSRMTGDFLDYYTQFTDEIVAPAAKEKQVQTSAAVTRKAIVDLEPDTAEVLVFINQSTTSRDNPDGSFTASAVKVVLEKQDGTWLISAFDPV